MLISTTTLVTSHVNCMQYMKLTASGVQEMTLWILISCQSSKNKHAQDEINRLELHLVGSILQWLE